MFTLVQSNQLERLSARLAKDLSHKNPSTVLKPEQILVQSPGMATWLRLEVARHLGIAAALEFPLPSNFIWSLCYALLPGVPRENAFTKDAMTWKLMTLLPRYIGQEHFSPLSDYLCEQSPLKLYQLANRIADVFDHYLVYRPDWILAWEQNESLNTTEINMPDNCRWQPILWRALIDYTCNELHQSHWHRANLHQSLVTSLQDPQTDLSSLPQRLFVFGISSLPPQTLEVLYALASRIQVTMLSLSPCRQYWGDILDVRQRARLALKYSHKRMLPAHWEDTLEVGNPLLAANGKMGRELMDLLLSLPESHLCLDDREYQPMEDHCLLGRLQNDILDMQVAGRPLTAELEHYRSNDGKLLLNARDHSVVLRSCHSPLREVETLHDHLLKLLSDSHGRLAPRDIVVMLPDVTHYAPFIDAVFGARHGDNYIPYAIADRGAAEESSLIQAFITLLQLTDSRFGLSEILGLLEVPAVMTRFAIDEEELLRLSSWLNQAGVRWGRDADARQALGLPAFDKHSWAFGIRRLLLGYALGDDGDFYQDTLPLSGVEGQQAQCVGNLLDFIEVLDDFRQHFADSATLDECFSRLYTLLDDLFEPSSESLDELLHIRQTLSETHVLLSQAGELNALPLEVLHQQLKIRLTESRVGQRFLAGAVNFCTLMPMRSIPFQVVCLLGMNDGVYPRQQHPVGFDLIAHGQPRRGDRSRRLDDRYLFLEALLSARQQLYISFTGRSERDDSQRLPSLLVSELLDCCELSAFTDNGNLRERLVRQQPLQPFDRRLYQADNSDSLTYSFAAQWCPSAMTDAQSTEPMPTSFVDGELSAAEDETDEIELAALIRFFRDPARFFCQRRLRLDLGLRLESMEDSEPFEVDKLGRHQLQAQLLSQALDVEEREQEMSLAALEQQLAGSGVLPVAPFDKLLLTSYRQDLAPLLERARFVMGESSAETVKLSLMLSLPAMGNSGSASSVCLTGTVEKVYPKGLLVTRPGTAKAKDQLALYLRHLAVCAQGCNVISYLLDAGHFYALKPLSSDEAATRLSHLCNLYRQAALHPLPLLPSLCEAYSQAKEQEPTLDHDAWLTAAATSWDDGNGQGECQEPHNQRLFSFPADFGALQFGALSLQIWRPLLADRHHGTLGELADFMAAPFAATSR